MVFERTKVSARTSRSRSWELCSPCVCACDNLWSSSVQTCRRAQAVCDFVSFAILVFVCDNLWSSNVQTYRRAQVDRDLVSFAFLVFGLGWGWGHLLKTFSFNTIYLEIQPASSNPVNTHVGLKQTLARTPVAGFHPQHLILHVSMDYSAVRFWLSNVPKHDLVIICGLRAYKRVGAHKSFAIS